MGGGGWIMELQVIIMFTKHDDENVNRAVAGFSWIRRNSWKDVCIKSLSEWRSRVYGANVKLETVPDCVASEKEGPFSEGLSVCGWNTKRKAVRRWAKLTKGCISMQSLWQMPGTTFRKGAMTQRWDLVLNPTWYCMKANEGNREQEWCDVATSLAAAFCTLLSLLMRFSGAPASKELQ